MGEAVARKVLRYRRDEPGWKICREGNGVSVSWRPSVESRGPVPRGRCVWGLVKPLPGSLREKWEENVTSSEIIQSITDCCNHTMNVDAWTPLGFDARASPERPPPQPP
ncbi:StAR related lipid transfer domain containing 5 [Rhinolophus ferrumequinum]|uniref:StAR related lipid transfer domain containing 5 n=1 Tax=Rhinolophus ferrumequinum TaxID=59479 RepID=A0A671FUX8_RHIFE|nr:StAR related lipid transfer domain containing 5 [Rhinolophus ferrumequinum]